MNDIIERQLKLEEESRELGAARYQAERLPWKDEHGKTKPESELPPGMYLLKQIVEPVAEGVRQFLAEAQAGRAGRKHTAAKLLQEITPEAAAYIVCKRVINGLTTQENTQAVLINIGMMVRDHIEFERFHSKEPRLYRWMIEELKKATSGRHRTRVLRRVLSRAQVERLGWGNEECLSVGGKLLDILIERTGMVRVVTVSTGKRRSKTVIEPAEDVLEWLNNQHERCALLSPVYLPMLCEPVDWTGPKGGGYLTQFPRPMHFVKTGNQEYLEELEGVDMPKVYEAVNLLQRVPWRVNRFILEVMDEAWKHGDQVGGLPPRDPEPLPATPPDMDTNEEALKAWKRAASEVYTRNARLGSKRLGVEQKLWMARKFVDEQAIYYPWCVDFRGRAYPIAGIGSMNPQADDSGKALLEFANGEPLGEDGAYWLAVHIANLFGVDKVSLDDRVAWVEKNTDKILDSALRPLDGERFWCEADKPWQALAACKEWLGYQMEGDDYVSHLPIAMDGSCNGLQNFSAALRDPVGAAATNLLPSATPNDIYQQVADETERMLAQSSDPMALLWRGRVSRKIVKRPVMTLPYGATLFGMRDQIADELRKAEEAGTPIIPKDQVGEASTYLAKVVYEAIGNVVVAAREAMDWLQEAAKVVSGNGLPILWTTPDGFPVLQNYRKIVTHRQKVHFDGQVYRLSLGEETREIDVRKNALAISPNFVHSLDAAHMRATVRLCNEHGVTSLVMVHDSYGCHASKVSEMNYLLRRAFYEQYQGHILADFRDELASQLPPDAQEKLPKLPELGTLDLEQVLRSDFFFA